MLELTYNISVIFSLIYLTIGYLPSQIQPKMTYFDGERFITSMYKKVDCFSCKLSKELVRENVFPFLDAKNFSLQFDTT